MAASPQSTDLTSTEIVRLYAAGTKLSAARDL